MVTIRREADRTTAVEMSKKHQVSDATIDAWHQHFGQMTATDVKWPKSFELANMYRQKPCRMRLR